MYFQQTTQALGLTEEFLINLADTTPVPEDFDNRIKQATTPELWNKVWDVIGDEWLAYRVRNVRPILSKLGYEVYNNSDNTFSVYDESSDYVYKNWTMDDLENECERLDAIMIRYEKYKTP